MRVVNDGRTYDVNWRYTVVPSEKSGIQVVRTECDICQVITRDGEKNEYPILATGSVTQNTKDRHVKDEARKRSLTKALKQFANQKSVRITFWNAYFGRNTVETVG